MKPNISLYCQFIMLRYMYVLNLFIISMFLNNIIDFVEKAYIPKVHIIQVCIFYSEHTVQLFRNWILLYTLVLLIHTRLCFA